jgi:disulfide oxidoreductase YuzD
MKTPIEVTIIGVPVACQEGVKELWRDVAVWAKGQLKAKYGSKAVVRYFDLFDPACPTFPPESQLPVVFVNEKVVSSGGKISIPLIRAEIDLLIANGLSSSQEARPSSDL